MHREKKGRQILTTYVITKIERTMIRCLRCEQARFLVVNAGGNDALSHGYIFNQDAQSTAEVLQRLADIRDEFQRNYQNMLQVVLSCNLPTAICSIYYPRFPDPFMQRMAKFELSIFNDCVTCESFRFRLQLIDLRREKLRMKFLTERKLAESKDSKV